MATQEATASSTRSASTCGSGLLLFVLSTFSYLVDYFHLQGMLRWALIILFMLLKAGFIVAIFMHMAWERLALKLAILVPPLCLLVLIGLMAIEGDYTFLTRSALFCTEPAGAAGTFPFTPRRGSDTMRTSPAAECPRAHHTRPDRPRPEGHRHLLAGRQGRQHGIPVGADPARPGDLESS